MIQGIEFNSLSTHTDERGFFREILRNTDDIFKGGFGQISHSIVLQDVIKAWHYHKYQTQWNYVVDGLIKVVLHDLRKDSLTFGETVEFLAGDYQEPIIYCFPAGVAHGYKCLSGPMNIIYITSGIYDPAEEGRIEHNTDLIKYNWLDKRIK